MLYGYIGKSTNTNISSCILGEFNKTHPCKHKETSDSALIMESNINEEKKDLLSATHVKYFKSYQLMPSQYIFDANWLNIETTATLHKNRLWLFRSTKENLFVVNASKSINQIWFFSSLEAWKNLNLPELQKIKVFPDNEIWRLTNKNENWKLKKIKIESEGVLSS